MSTSSVRLDLLNGLKTDPQYRHAWNLENVYVGVCFQIRALREQRKLSQAELGKAAKMAQERISILEDPNADTKPTLNTLLRIADAFDVGLDVRFVPHKTVIERSTTTNMKQLEVPGFDDEVPELEQWIKTEIRQEEEIERYRLIAATLAPYATTLSSSLTGLSSLGTMSNLAGSGIPVSTPLGSLPQRSSLTRKLGDGATANAANAPASSVASQIMKVAA